jgi:NOL1/NOP2/fmu family ribosome biogenesis protein
MTRASQRFDRVPSTETDREDGDPPSREAVVAFFEERYGIPPATFEEYTFWERGSGKLWAFRGDLATPVVIEALGMTLLRTRQEHWKPTTDGVQRFGGHATQNVIELDRADARWFVAGEDQELAWDGDWGYLVVAHEYVGGLEPLGVGLYLYGELRSQVPKGRRRTLDR